MILYHGSSRPLKGETLNPSQGYDAPEREENNLFAVYATDLRDTAIILGVFSCPDVVGGSLDDYEGERLIARLHGEFPKQKYIYLHHLSDKTFTQTKIISHQFVSEVPVKPIKTEKIRIGDYKHLFDRATKDETIYFLKKYHPEKLDDFLNS